MEYTIDWMEINNTKDGKRKATVTLVDEKNVQIEDVTIWPDFPGFVDIKPGSKVTGTVTEKKGLGNKVWKSLHTVSFYRKPKVDKAPEIAKAMETKQKNILESQEKKADSIKTSSTFRAATDTCIQWRAERMAKGVVTSAEEWQTEWRAVRAWFNNNWELPF